MSEFADKLHIGQKFGESPIGKWLRDGGFNVQPVYEKVYKEFKGPTLFAADGNEYILPDIFCFKRGAAFFVEAKFKTTFSFHRNTSCWTTGIDIACYEHYQKVMLVSDWPIYLLFLHAGGFDKDTGEKSPSGLYGGKLENLMKREHHRSTRHGKGGMVYWGIEDLKKYTTYESLVDNKISALESF